jgi:hypothetical protein
MKEGDDQASLTKTTLCFDVEISAVCGVCAKPRSKECGSQVVLAADQRLTLMRNNLHGDPSLTGMAFQPWVAPIEIFTWRPTPG